MMRLFKYLGFTLFLPIWWLQRLVPRNKNIWVFGAWYGHRYADNSRSLFLYCSENHPEIKCIWLTRNKDVLEKVVSEGGKAFMTDSLKGIYYSLLAKNVFISSGKKDVNPLFINGANWIQLWHGSPFKKIGLDDKYANTNTFFQRIIVKNVFPFASELNYHRVVSNASFFTPILASAFGVGENRIMETGSPRNDVFYNSTEHVFNRELRKKFQGVKILYYLPTFRGHQGVNSFFGLSDYDVEKTGAFLEEQNLVWINKAHYIDYELDSNAKEHDRIIHLANEDITDINEMLKDADLLITDYSSIYFDYLLTERPVIFAAFDLVEYITGNRELPFRYEDVIAGPIVKNWEGLLDVLSNIFERSNFESLIRKKNQVFNKYHDDQNSKRVFEAISKL